MNNLINQNQQATMSSTQLAEMLKHDKKEINKKIRAMFSDKIAGEVISLTLRANGQVSEYHLPELESKMFVAKNDIQYLEEITQYWIDSKSKPALPSTKELAYMVIKAEEEKEAALLEVDRLQGICQTITAQFKTGMTPARFCKQLNGVNIQQVNKTLVELNKLRVDGKGYSPTSVARDVLFKANYGDFAPYPTLLLKGAKWLYRAYLGGKLPMKKTWDGKLIHVVFEGEA